VVSKVRERLSVSKRAAQKLDMEIFKLTGLNDVESKGQYQVKISHRFAAMGNVDDDDDDDDDDDAVDINRPLRHLRMVSCEDGRLMELCQDHVRCRFSIVAMLKLWVVLPVSNLCSLLTVRGLFSGAYKKSGNIFSRSSTVSFSRKTLCS
jgi:hypothetical protein